MSIMVSGLKRRAFMDVKNIQYDLWGTPEEELVKEKEEKLLAKLERKRRFAHATLDYIKKAIQEKTP
jgi:hypothetical protein